MTISQVREFWDRQPCNAHHSDSPVNSLRYSQEVTSRKLRVEQHIVEHMDLWTAYGKDILDLGCGIGTQAILFAKAGARVWALDISEKSLEIARKRTVALGLQNNIAFVQGNIEDLYLKPELLGCKFDLVYSFGVLHHTPCPERALGWARHYMHRDSILKIMLYHRYTPKVLSALASRSRPGMSVDDAVAKMSEAQAGSPITRTYTRASATKLLADFEITEMHVDHIFPYRIRDYIQRCYVRKWYWRLLPGGAFRWLEHHFGWHLLITARLREA